MKKVPNSVIIILSTLASGIGVYLFDKIWGQYINWKNINFFGWLSIQVEIYKIILFLICFFVLLLIFYHFGKGKEAKRLKAIQQANAFKQQISTERRNILKKFNQSQIDYINWKFSVNFDGNNRPYITDLMPYCVRHDPQMRMNESIGGIFCGINNCDNLLMFGPFGSDTYKRITGIIESHLEAKWERLNKV